MTIDTPRPLTAQIAALLTTLYADCRGFIRITIGRGAWATSVHLRAGACTFTPDPLLTELGYTPPPDIACSLATGGGPTGTPLLDLGAVGVEIPLPPVCDVARGWLVPEATFAAAVAPLAGFLPPTAVIDAAWSLVALWRLDRPLRLDVPAELGEAERLHRALAERLGGRLDAVQVIRPGGLASLGGARYDSMPAWAPARPIVRLPGTRNRDAGGGDGGRVQLAALDASHRYTLTQIDKEITR